MSPSFSVQETLCTNDAYFFKTGEHAKNTVTDKIGDSTKGKF